MSEKRYNHSIGCADTAKKLAQIYKLDEEKAYTAGLVHDSAKNFENEELLKIINSQLDLWMSLKFLKLVNLIEFF